MLMVSSIAHADGTDASLIAGMSTIEDLDAGVLVGARFGFTLSDSLALDVQTLRHTGIPQRAEPGHDLHSVCAGNGCPLLLLRR